MFKKKKRIVTNYDWFNSLDIIDQARIIVNFAYSLHVHIKDIPWNDPELNVKVMEWMVTNPMTMILIQTYSRRINYGRE